MKYKYEVNIPIMFIPGAVRSIWGIFLNDYRYRE